MRTAETVKLTSASAAIKRLGRALSFFLLLPIACHLLPVSAQAEVPVKFTYQGNLRQAGFLVNGQRAMRFRIYSSSTAGSLLWETSAPIEVSVSTGVFRVTLEPATLTNWQSGSLWLELQVESNIMSPREELTSSPYAINSLMLSGKRYTSANAEPAAYSAGDLWYNTSLNGVNYWNGTAWISISGAGPVAHAATHAGGGTDAITSLGAHTVTGALTLEGTLNPAANLNIGGAGYSVAFASSVTAGWFAGNGSGLYSLDASKITSGLISGDRIGEVIVSTHIADGSIKNQDLEAGAVTRDKIGQSGCNFGELLQWNGSQWACGSPGAVVEYDPSSIHDQSTLQAGTVFYVSSGTANDLNVNNSLKVMGTALLKGAPGQQGLSVESTGNVGVGMTNALARLEVKGADTQNYSFAVSTGAAHQVVVSTSGAVGIGTETPRAKLDVAGSSGAGEYIMIFNSGPKIAAWLRNK
ncbi:MAG: hypothetical protein A2X35_03105 [Elusimicrobia bacterium GWA2_61_42]|nr:MAG: hypothetical protein A2X35_03105 [Elusimicrobia bacterium GWA2_61_42]OGR74773.1 MAG: hypothetical protein A2X38_08390 [Elusimicrobia bacterium GWC2_61_25]